MSKVAVFKKRKHFTAKLMSWHKQAPPRFLPWKENKNPYYIWLSEIILQQTRVEQGLPYFIKFKTLFPTIQKLAAASSDEIMKAWQGLGYYSRARNLHFSAKFVVEELGGEFPQSYKEVLSLKGVGPYTAAAICSFAFDQPYAVVDGNVYRVLSRFFGISTAIDSTLGKKEFASLAQELITPQQPGDYNQAIMDFGAKQCSPKSPNCGYCSLNKNCTAYQDGLVHLLPKKDKKIKKRKRFFQFLILETDGKTFIEKREEKDIWNGLYQFPMIETEEECLNSLFLKKHPLWKGVVEAKQIIKLKQILTHQEINACFWQVEMNNYEAVFHSFTPVNYKKIHEFAVPKIIDLFLLETKGIFVK